MFAPGGGGGLDGEGGGGGGAHMWPGVNEPIPPISPEHNIACFVSMRRDNHMHRKASELIDTDIRPTTTLIDRNTEKMKLQLVHPPSMAY